MTKEAGKKIEAGTRVTMWKNGVHLTGTVVKGGSRLVSVVWDQSDEKISQVEAYRLRLLAGGSTATEFENVKGFTGWLSEAIESQAQQDGVQTTVRVQGSEELVAESNGIKFVVRVSQLKG